LTRPGMRIPLRYGLQNVPRPNYRAFATATDYAAELPKGLSQAVTTSTDKLVARMNDGNVMRVSLKRGDMLGSETVEQQILFEIADTLAEKASLTKVLFVLPKKEMLKNLKDSQLTSDRVRAIDIESAQLETEALEALVLVNSDEFVLRPSRLLAQRMKMLNPNMPIIVCNPRSKWREVKRDLQMSGETVFFMEQGPDKPTGTVMVTSMGDEVWRAWNVIWTESGGNFELLLDQSREPSNEEVVAAVFEINKQRLWEEAWSGVFDKLNVKGPTREWLSKFVKQFGA